MTTDRGAGRADWTHWTAPSAEDAALLAAQHADDVDAYLAVLARLDVFVPRRDDQDSKFSFRKSVVKLNQLTAYGQLNNAIRGTSKSALTVGLEYATTRHGLRLVLPIHTRALVPDERPEGVYFHQYMFPGWVQELAKQRRTMQLLVNPGTPLERELNVGEAASWLKRNPRAVGHWADLRTRVRTVFNEPFEGDLARSLACGAHLALYNAVPWNTMGKPWLDYHSERETLRDWWGIEGPVQWQNQVDALLDTENPRPVDLVLGIRAERGAGAGARAGAGAGTRPTGDLATDTAQLTEAVTAWSHDHGVPEDLRRELSDIARWVTTCESWMRRDEVLPPDGIVTTQRAWDWGRCVNMARWGLASGYCDRATAEQIVRYAGSLCARTYADWSELSAAYVLGRVVKMGRQSNPEETYRESLSLHGTLMGDPGSPWRNLKLR
ncbi:MAG: DUF1266 domain-containing protein [Catenulispora sp.]